MTLFLLLPLFGADTARAASAPPAATPPVIFGLHVGVNVPPDGVTLSPLRYADDDAARFYLLTRDVARRVELFTVLDGESAKRHADLVSQARLPRRAEIDRALTSLTKEMATARRQGNKVVLLFSYSGHGVREQGEGVRLALLDGVLDRAFFEKKLARLPADAVHLFIDACHGEGLLAARGLRGEREGTAQPLDPNVSDRTFGRLFFARHPHVGAIFASAQDALTHEWSELEAGLFSYELLSGLRGAADINLDERVGYGEVAAFVAAANRAVQDPRAQLRVVVEPPRHAAAETIVDLRWFHRSPVVVASAARLGHFSVERDDGLRLLDAHLEDDRALRIVLPTGRGAFLKRGDGMEAFLPLRSGTTLPLESLTFGAGSRVAARGSAERALRAGFFKAPLSQAFYEGYVESAGIAPVSFAAEEPPTAPAPTAPPQELDTSSAAQADPYEEFYDEAFYDEGDGEESGFPFVAAALGAGAGGAALITAGLGVGAAFNIWTFNNTTMQRESRDTLVGSWVFGILTGIGGLATLGLAGGAIGALVMDAP